LFAGLRRELLMRLRRQLPGGMLTGALTGLVVGAALGALAGALLAAYLGSFLGAMAASLFRYAVRLFGWRAPGEWKAPFVGACCGALTEALVTDLGRASTGG